MIPNRWSGIEGEIQSRLVNPLSIVASFSPCEGSCVGDESNLLGHPPTVLQGTPPNYTGKMARGKWLSLLTWPPNTPS